MPETWYFSPKFTGKGIGRREKSTKAYRNLSQSAGKYKLPLRICFKLFCRSLILVETLNVLWNLENFISNNEFESKSDQPKSTDPFTVFFHEKNFVDCWKLKTWEMNLYRITSISWMFESVRMYRGRVLLVDICGILSGTPCTFHLVYGVKIFQIFK